jgi:hypothetical protein
MALTFRAPTASALGARKDLSAATFTPAPVVPGYALSLPTFRTAIPTPAPAPRTTGQLWPR